MLGIGRSRRDRHLGWRSGGGRRDASPSPSCPSRTSGGSRAGIPGRRLARDTMASLGQGGSRTRQRHRPHLDDALPADDEVPRRNRSRSGADYLVESSIQSESGRLRITSKLIRVATRCRCGRSLRIGADHHAGPAAGAEHGHRAADPDSALSRTPDAWPGGTRGTPMRTTSSSGGLYFGNQLTPATNKTCRRVLRAREPRSIRTIPSPGRAIALAFAASPINSGRAAAAGGGARPGGGGTCGAVRPGPGRGTDLAGIRQFDARLELPVAEAALRRAIVLDPNNVRAHVTLGHLLSQERRQEEAETMMRRGARGSSRSTPSSTPCRRR
jgi:hypothetical protein